MVSTMCSISSRKVASAQWMSSNTTTSGRVRAIVSSSLRAPQRAPARERGGSEADRRGDPRDDLVVTFAIAASFASADSIESRSAMSAAWRTASASGQNVMPSP